jgi:two-component system OmpR family response regulator
LNFEIILVLNVANILLIDDEPLLLDLTSTALRRDGHRVMPMSDALSALDSYRLGHDAVDLVVTDVSMSPVGGFELVKRLEALGFRGEVLFMSGYAAVSEGIADSLGEGSIIEKPFTAAQFRSAVNEALAGSKRRAADLHA